MARPQIQAIVTADVSGMRKGAKEVESTVKTMGQKMRSQLNDVGRQAITAAGAAVTAGVTATFVKSMRDGMKQAFAMDNAQVLMEGTLGSLDKAREAMAMISAEAQENPLFSKEALAEAAAGLSNFADGNVGKLKNMVELSEKLSLLKPSAGLDGAREALQDALGGQFERLQEYSFGSKEIAGLKDAAARGADMTEAFAKALDAKGITDKTLTAANNTLQAAFAGVENELTNLGQSVTDAMGPELIGELKEVRAFLQANSGEIIQAMQGVGSAIVEGFKAAQTLGKWVNAAEGWVADKVMESTYSAKSKPDAALAAGSKYLWDRVLGTGHDVAMQEARQEYDWQRGAQLGARTIEVQNNIRMSAPTGSLMPGMQHT